MPRRPTASARPWTGSRPMSCCPTCMPGQGHKATDHLRIMALVEAALDLAEEILAPGGAFLCKVLQGGASKELVARLNRSFAKVRHVKPKASRANSAEMYVLATGFRGADAADMRRSRNCASSLARAAEASLLSLGSNSFLAAKEQRHESRSGEGLLRQGPQELEGPEDLGLLRRRRRAGPSRSAARQCA